jgi:hypothetical protein
MIIDDIYERTKERKPNKKTKNRALLAFSCTYYERNRWQENLSWIRRQSSSYNPCEIHVSPPMPIAFEKGGIEESPMIKRYCLIPTLAVIWLALTKVNSRAHNMIYILVRPTLIYYSLGLPKKGMWTISLAIPLPSSKSSTPASSPPHGQYCRFIPAAFE